MRRLINLILRYWDSILVVILFALFLLYLIKKGAIKQVNEILFYLVTEAEKQFGGGTGQLKYAAVVAWLYERLPLVTKFLITAKQLDEMIEESVHRMKDYLEKNKDARLLILK